MRIYRPEELHLMRQGLPTIPANLGGKGGSTSSAQNTSTTTTNTDKRIANDGGLVAQDGSTITYNSTSVDPETVKAAFDFATNANATNGDGFTKLLDTVDRLTTKTTDAQTSLSSRFQDNVLQAFDQAKAAASGGIDQKTMIIFAVAGAAAVVLVNRKK